MENFEKKEYNLNSQRELANNCRLLCNKLTVSKELREAKIKELEEAIEKEMLYKDGTAGQDKLEEVRKFKDYLKKQVKKIEKDLEEIEANIEFCQSRMADHREEVNKSKNNN